ncbi:GTP-binding protein [Mariniluteicoccus endophyticus]
MPETEAYGISSLVYRSDRLFHPQRLWDLVSTLDDPRYGRVLRSKGFFVLASRPGISGLWSQAGAVARFEPLSLREPDSPTQEIVLIGTDLDHGALRTALDACLVVELDGHHHRLLADRRGRGTHDPRQQPDARGRAHGPGDAPTDGARVRPDPALHAQGAASSWK